MSTNRPGTPLLSIPRAGSVARLRANHAARYAANLAAHLAAHLAVLLGVTFIAACGPGGAGKTGKGSPAEVNSGLSALAANSDAQITPAFNLDPNRPPSPDETGAILARNALDIEQVMQRVSQRGTDAANSEGTPQTGTRPREPRPANESTGLRALAAERTQPAPPPREEQLDALSLEAVNAWSHAVEASPLPDAAEGTAEERAADLARKIARLLRAPGADQPRRMSDAAALAPLESARPGTLMALGGPGCVLSPHLNADELRVLIEARDRLAQTPAERVDISRDLGGVLAPATLRVAKAFLCTRVSGFGRYNAYPDTSFPAGQPVRAIVYVEVENFTARPARESDPVLRDASVGEQVSVELSQALTLFHDQSGLQVWHRPAQTIIDSGRNTRRDFYLVQQIELPRTLTIGRYNLKVRVTDKTSGAEAEALIPLSIVAGSPLRR
ncbi:MAG: hypothetical protein KF864_05365 [Phycisphaeraceae bacterium]|nr:hypothetical protein [Phycisphaeraceae bacterium]